jgi:hypothetical protein
LAQDQAITARDLVFWQIDMFEPTRLLPARDGIPLIDAVRSYAPAPRQRQQNNFRLLKIEARPVQPQQQNQSHCEVDGYIFISCPATDAMPGRA